MNEQMLFCLTDDFALFSCLFSSQSIPLFNSIRLMTLPVHATFIYVSINRIENNCRFTKWSRACHSMISNWKSDRQWKKSSAPFVSHCLDCIQWQQTLYQMIFYGESELLVSITQADLTQLLQLNSDSVWFKSVWAKRQRRKNKTQQGDTRESHFRFGRVFSLHLSLGECVDSYCTAFIQRLLSFQLILMPLTLVCATHDDNEPKTVTRNTRNSCGALRFFCSSKLIRFFFFVFVARVFSFYVFSFIFVQSVVGGWSTSLLSQQIISSVSVFACNPYIIFRQCNQFHCYSSVWLEITVVLLSDCCWTWIKRQV